MLKTFIILTGLFTLQALQLMMTNSQPKSTHQKLNKSVLQGLFATSIVATTALFAPKSSLAKVYFDTDVYGDKELKIATVNKIKQKLRNAILEDNAVAPQLLQLAINDALGFNAATLAGGPDGSVRFEMSSEGPNAGLEKALALLLKIQKELQRTNVVGFGDLCSFGGAEALETAGCPRMTVQVGRFDAKTANEISTPISWKAPSAESIQAAFSNAGLDARDIAVLIGALGELNRVVKETLLAKEKNAAEVEDEDDAEFEEQPFVPTTFGSRDAMYGAKMGKGDFGSKYFSSILSGKDKDELARVLLEDAKVKSFVTKYASNDALFTKDVSEVYLKLTNMGSELCSSKFCQA